MLSTFKTREYGQASTSVPWLPSAEKLDLPGGIRKTTSLWIYPCTHIDVHENRGDLRKGKNILVSPIIVMLCISKGKMKIGLRKKYWKKQVRKSWKWDSGQILIVKKQDNLRFLWIHEYTVICASHASLKYMAGRRNKSNPNRYPSDNTVIVTDDSPTQAKLAYYSLLVAMMAGSGLNSA